MGRSFLLTVRPFYLRMVFVAYGKLVWSFLLTVVGLFDLRWRIGLVFFACGSPHVQKLDLVFFAYGFPTVSQKPNCK